MIFVDSSVWIAYFNGVDSEPTRLLDTALGTTRIVVGDLVLAEVLQGFRADRDFRQARTLMLHLDVRSVLSPALALRAAEHYRFLRRQGTTVRKTIDTVIATYCIDEDLPLLHDDTDFLPFEQHLGLRRAEIG
ncbi:MAG: PIN domain nuclease [Polycyclovorans sp.]|jgi:predicted nucleic acid-binding protein|nr:VapC toxin family PIN domain ribonuclease [Polycyclovorans sp.]MBU0791320.1 PIN domain nuclease [Gammaproteobacteria bacterium]MDP1541714.1 PIN domain nuclease [Polycyclovorans sp.]|tara:strand:+ start:236 stop:634 length:399 start_codon:yes stop_codon:yes gene_type:complete